MSYETGGLITLTRGKVHLRTTSSFQRPLHLLLMISREVHQKQGRCSFPLLIIQFQQPFCWGHTCNQQLQLALGLAKKTHDVLCASCNQQPSNNTVITNISSCSHEHRILVARYSLKTKLHKMKIHSQSNNPKCCYKSPWCFLPK
jgi:hypothetical protein